MKKLFTNVRIISFIGAFVLVVSAFMSWGYTEYVSVAGVSETGDGYITIGTGLLAFVFLFFQRIPIGVSFLLGMVGLVIGIIDFVAMKNALDAFGGKIGIGLYLTVVGSLAIVVGTVWEMTLSRKKKSALPYLDKC